MMQKDLKIVAMIFHIILHPAELETEKTTGQTTDGGIVDPFYTSAQISGLSVYPHLVNQCWPRLPPCVAAGLVRYQRCAARGGGPQVPGSSPGPRPVSRPAHRRHQLPPPSGDQPGQCCPDPRRVQTHAVSSGHTVTLLQIHTQLRFISLPCTNLLRSACDS